MLVPEERTKIAPSLLFVNDNFGRAEEAINFYLSQFPNSDVISKAKNPGGKHLDHCAFSLAGQRFSAMDGPGEHKFKFSEAFSFMVLCKDQDEIDKYWQSLAEEGSHSQCGWLKDRYGVSWQIIPENLLDWQTKDQARCDRIMKAVMKMAKLDYKTIETA